jgi:hypothetical protein
MKRIDELAAANAEQAATIVNLRQESASRRVKEEAAIEETSMVGRRLAAVTERAARAERLAENAAVQIENWKSKWQTVRALFEEADPGRHENGVECGPRDMSPPEGERAIPPVVAAKGVCTEGDHRCQREEADCIEGAIVLLRAAARYSRNPLFPSGQKNGPLNDLRGSKSDDAVEPGMSPELLLQAQNPRKGELQEPPESSPPIPDNLVDTSPQPESSNEP